MRQRSFRPLRDVPALAWLAAVVVATVVHPWLPAPRWLMLHLLFLGAITHSILVWSQHFATTLLRRETDQRGQTARLAAVNGGAVLVVIGILTAFWPVVVVGGTAVGLAVLWHGIDLGIRLRRALGSRFAVTVRYYVASALFLAVGVVLGVLLGRNPAGETYDRLILGHALVNVLGWIGLTVLGTLVTLWPTILRTRMIDGAVTTARRALWPLGLGLLVAGAGALIGRPEMIALGLLSYLAGAGIGAGAMIRTARTKPPTTYAALSVAAAVTWLVGCLLVLVVGAALGIPSGDLTPAADMLDAVAPFLAAGTAAQVLLGALSYLMPVQVSRGPASARAANAAIDRAGVFRVVVANTMLVLCLLPVPSAVRLLASVVYLAAMVAFVPLTVAALRAARAAAAAAPDPVARQVAAVQDRGAAATPGPRAGEAPDRVGTGVGPAQGGGAASARLTPGVGPAQAGGTTSARVTPGVGPAGASGAASARPQLAGVLVAVLAVVVGGVLMDPTAAGFGQAASADVTPTGRTETVQVVAEGMSFTPDVIEVEAGTELIIEVTNVDTAQVHDLVLATGHSTPRLAPDESATIEVGVVGADIEGWCSIVGHRQAGMTLDIVVTGGTVQADGADGADGGHAGHGTASADNAVIDPNALPGDDFEARDASLPPLPAADVPVTHRATWEIVEMQMEVAPGVTQELWTFDRQVPGPVLHGRVGDRFEITIVNNGTMGHSLDFHASEVAPDGMMRTIAPGESLTYTFTAHRSGVWMYHCGTAPVSAHIANGMAGAVVIEPAGLPEVDRSYLIVQADMYLGPEGGTVDVDLMATGRPNAMTFNGYVHQYVHRPLEARVGERVRLWVLDVGPNRPTSFHVIGGQFDTVWFEGDYLLRDGGATGDGGSQSLALQAAQGGFVELTFHEPGSYPFMTHIMSDAELGAHGVVRVE